MEINNEYIDELVKITKTNMVKIRENGIPLTDNQVVVLQRYNINYSNYSSLKEIIFTVEDILNNEECDDDLENVSQELSEFNYYNYTNK